MENCIFCKILKGEIPSKKIYEDDKVMVIMDINPTVDGHVLVIPKKHVEDYIEMDNDLLTHIYQVAKDLGPKLMKKLDAKALSLCINYGESQIIKHFHLHLLPNYHLSEKERDIEEVYNILKED